MNLSVLHCVKYSQNVNMFLRHHKVLLYLAWPKFVLLITILTNDLLMLRVSSDSQSDGPPFESRIGDLLD